MKSFTDIEQSKKLAEILPIESADTHYYLEQRDVATSYEIGITPFTKAKEFIGKCNIINVQPSWSLAALRNLLPPAIKPNKDSCLFLFESHNTFDKSWVYRYYNEDDTSYLYYKNTNEVDACVEMIIRLNELNLL